MRLIIKYGITIASIYILSMLMDSISIDSIPALFILGAVLLLVNMLLKPLMLLIALPVSLLTFGVFNLIVNAWTIMIADSLVPGISMGGFWNALLIALIIVILHQLMGITRRISVG